MHYNGEFRFKSIERKRFYDAPLIAFIVIVCVVTMIQLGLLIAGKPDLRTLMLEKGNAAAEIVAGAVQTGGHDQN